MLQYVELHEAQNSGHAFLRLSGAPAGDGTLRYKTDISLIESGGIVREIVRHKTMTFDEAKKRTAELAKKRGVAFAVMELPPLTVATITIGLPSAR